MGIKSSFRANNSDILVHNHLGTAYDTVRYIAERMDKLDSYADAIELLNTWLVTLEGIRDQAIAAQGLAESAQGQAELNKLAAEAAQGAAEVAQSLAELAQTGAEAAEGKAEQWAEETTDTEVEAGKYSAKHWAEKAADTVATGVTGSNNNAELARKWAEEADEVLVDGTGYSAKHWAGKAEDEKTTAAGHATDAGSAKQLADRYANWPEDIEVEPGKYSAAHFAEKAAASAALAESKTGDFVEEAPADTKQYARVDNSWVEVVTFADSPADGKQYARIDNTWQEVVTFPDANADGKQYIRKDNDWHEVEIPSGTEYSALPPANPQERDLWVSSDTFELFMYISGSWVEVSRDPTGLVEEAPTDGVEYLRRDGVWVANTDEVGSGGGGSGDTTYTVQNGDFAAEPLKKYYVHKTDAKVAVTIPAAAIAVGEHFSVTNSANSGQNVTLDSTNYDIIGETGSLTSGALLELRNGEFVELLCVEVGKLHITKP